MKKLVRFAFAATLTAMAVLAAPVRSEAATWCATCDATGDCVACCRCDGGGAGYCYVYCYGW